MKLAVIGAGRVDVSNPGSAPEIKDPFLVLVRALCDHFERVSVEINTPVRQMDDRAAREVLGRLELGCTVRYSSFLNYFVSVYNFTPSKMIRLSRMIASADVALLRVPGPVVFVAALLCRLYKKPYVTFVASDLHQIANNLAEGNSGVGRIKGRAIRRLVGVLKSRVVWGANRRLYLSEKMRADYCDTESDNSALFATSIVHRVHPVRPTNVGDGNVRLIFVGRLVVEKGLFELTEICAGLARKGFMVYIDVVGDGPESQMLSDAFSKLECENINLVLHGWVSDREYLDHLMVAADFCLLPSHNEGTPKVIYEAWATSTIFVGASVGGIPVAVEDGIDGVLFDVGDSDDAVARINAMIDDPAQIDRMNQIAGKKVANFTVECTAEKLTCEVRACFQ